MKDSLDRKRTLKYFKYLKKYKSVESGVNDWNRITNDIIRLVNSMEWK